jgi:hypothetical protein
MEKRDRAMPPLRKRRPKKRWRYAIGELFLIVAGITIAFWLESWRENVGAHAEERDILQGLLLDFEETRSTVQVQRELTQVRVESTLYLLGLINPEPAQIDNQSITSEIARLLTTQGFFVPNDATLSSLLNGPGIGILTSYELRVRLSGWSGFVSEIQRIDGRLEEAFLDHLMPHLQGRIPIRSLDALSDSNLSPSSFTFDYGELLSNLEFENLINEVYYFSLRKADALAEVDKELVQIIEMIRAESDLE